MTRIRYLLLIITILAQFAAAITQDSAQDGHMYFFNGRALNSILADSANNAGLKLSVNPEVKPKLRQTVSGKFVVSSIDELFNSLGRLYGFEWFKFAGNVYITPKDIETKTITIDSAMISNVMQYLNELNIVNPKFPITAVPGDNKIIISGPSDYINLVTKKIQQLGLRTNQDQLMVFRLKYASAIDTVYFINNQSAAVNNTIASNQTLTVPGVATILTGLLNSGNPGTTPISSKVKDSTQTSAESTSPTLAKASSPTIQADERTNSILIRDSYANYSLYNNVITALDIPTPLIQIDVYTISVNQNKLNTFGASWVASTNGISGGYNASAIQDALVRIGSGLINPLTNQTVISNVPGFLLGLNFLANNGILQQVSQPSLVTTDSLPAIMSSNETIYLPTVTSQSSSTTQNSTTSTTSANNGLGQIQTTRSLLIVPHVIQNSPHGDKKVQLNINLQDGNFSAIQASSGSVGLLQSNINTQVVLVNGQALLLAGDTRTVTETVVTQVPGLGDIPLLGWLFKSKRTVEYNRRSFYLVIPKILDISKFNSNESMISGTTKIQLITPAQKKQLTGAGVSINNGSTSD
jgi:type III secretion protein C